MLDPEDVLTVMDVKEHVWLLEHGHDFPEMIYILGGKGNQFINGIPIPAAESEIYLIPIGTTHVFRPGASCSAPLPTPAASAASVASAAADAVAADADATSAAAGATSAAAPWSAANTDAAPSPTPSSATLTAARAAVPAALLTAASAPLSSPAAAPDGGLPGLRVRNVILRATWLAAFLKLRLDPEVKPFISWLLGERGDDAKPEWIKVQDRDGTLRKMTEQLKELVLQKPTLYQTRLTATILEFISILCAATRGGEIQQAEWPTPEISYPAEAALEKAIQSIPINKLSIKEIAARMKISERHLSRLFVQHYGMTSHRYIQNYRIQKAARLLQETATPIKEVIHHAGFQDIDHFYRLFKQKTGMTPGQYRRKSDHANRQ